MYPVALVAAVYHEAGVLVAAWRGRPGGCQDLRPRLLWYHNNVLRHHAAGCCEPGPLFVAVR